MSEAFLGEIRILSFNFAPRGWATCDGQIMSISQNTALFSLLGTTYGGNGTSNFALPDLRGRVPFHFAPGFNQGRAGGEENHTLTQTEIPAHTHTLQATTAAADTVIPANNTLAQGNTAVYAPAANLTALAAPSVTDAGGSQPHPNMQPYLVLNFVIALEGVYPSRT